MSSAISSGSADDAAASRRYRSGGGGKSVVCINLETIRLHLSAVYARVQSRVSVETLRPMDMFLGFNPTGLCLSAGAFTPPVRALDKTTPEKIASRVKLNFAFFLTNYVAVATTVAVVVALMHPGMVFFLAVVYGLWALHSYLIRNELVFFGVAVHSLLSVQQRFYLLFVVTAIVVVMECLGPTIFFVSITALIVLLHAFLRDPKHIENSSSNLFGAAAAAAAGAAEHNSSDEEAGSSGNEDNGSEMGVLVERPGVGGGGAGSSSKTSSSTTRRSPRDASVVKSAGR